MKSPEALKAYSDAKERAESLEMLKDISRWPGTTIYGRKLHVKRRKPDGSMPETGVVTERKPLRIYKFPEDNPLGEPVPQDYESYMAMINDGWVVD